MGFLLRLLSWYLGLLILWPLVGIAYRELLIHAGNRLLGAAGHGREVKFVEYHTWARSGVTKRADVAVLLGVDPAAAAETRRYVLARAVVTFAQPYTALAFLVALFLAGGASWNHRLSRCLAGVLALHLVMLAVVWLDLVHASWLYHPDSFSGPEWRRVMLTFTRAAISDWPAGIFIVPLLLWVVINRKTLLRAPASP